jgi:SSS family solute:Na+ symporter
VLALGLFLLFYGLWYQMPGNAWDYLAVTGNIYLASVFTLLVAGLYWKRATSAGAYAALVLGAIGPISFLVINVLSTKAGQLTPHPPVVLTITQRCVMSFHEIFPHAGSIPPAAAGASSFALAFLGMVAGSLLSRRPAAAKIPALEAAS